MSTNRREWDAAYVADRRNRIIKFLGGKCVHCDARENLEVDHIDRTTKAFDVMARARYSWGRIVDELAKCQLLCRDCHINKTRDEMHPGWRERRMLRAAARESAAEQRRMWARRNQVIRDLSARGVRATDIADYFGITPIRVYQIRKATA